MRLEEQMEQLAAESYELWDRSREIDKKEDELMEKLFPVCDFCEKGTVRVYHGFEDGWQIHCLHCPASTPYTKTFVEAVEYWKAMLKVKEKEDANRN